MSAAKAGTKTEAKTAAARHIGRLRVATLNLWGDNGPHQQRLPLIGQALVALDPDVVALQEVREIPGRLPNQAETLARQLGAEHVYAASTEWGGGSGGLALISRYPIVDRAAEVLPHSTKDEGRMVLSAAIDSPAGRLWAHTCHLSYRQHEGKLREDQVMVLDRCVTTRAESTNAPQFVLGDFNCEPEADEIRWLKGLTTLDGRRVFYQDAWEACRPGDAGITWAQENPFRAEMDWLKADRRLDYIFVTAKRRNGRGRVLSAELFCDRPDGNGVYGSDHYGVTADVQILSDDEMKAV